MRTPLALTALVLPVAVLLLGAAPVSMAAAADHCLGLVGELDVAARACAFSRQGAVAPALLWPTLSAFLGATVALTLVRRTMLRWRRR
jgi:hypothetical protein